MVYRLAIAIFILFGFNQINAQVGYQKDSLQIKVYATIDYVDGNAIDIKIKHVFCDYCSEYQKKRLSEEAKRRTFYIRNNKGVRMLKGTYRHAVYIRVSKEDLADLKEENIENTKYPNKNKPQEYKNEKS